MHRLLLLRHAKSSWADPGLRDHDRPLNDRGQRSASAMGEHLRAVGRTPDVVLCSSARRTCETAALLGLPDDVPIEIKHDLYLADPATVVELIRAVDEHVDTVMVIGHNPTTEEVALDLAGGGDEDALRRLGTKFPTGALAVLEFSGPWRDLADGGATLAYFVSPRDLEG